MSRDTPISGPVQVKVFHTLEQLGTGTVKEIARASGLTEMQASSAVDKLIEVKRAYICDWKFEVANSSSRVIKLGRGVSVPRWKTAKGQQDNLFKGDMHQIDLKQQHLQHQIFMQNFKPRPDVAAAWLLNPAQGEAA